MDTQDKLEDHLGPLPKDGGRLTPDWEVFWPAMLACAHAAQSQTFMGHEPDAMYQALLSG